MVHVRQIPVGEPESGQQCRQSRGAKNIADDSETGARLVAGLTFDLHCLRSRSSFRSFRTSRGRRNPDSQQRAGGQLGEASIGTVIHAGGIGRVKQQHHVGGGSSHDDKNRHGAHPFGLGDFAERHHQQRPNQIELHRHAQEPQMGQRRRQSGRLEIRHLAEDVHPIAGEQGARQRIGNHFLQQAGSEHPSEPRHHGNGRQHHRP